MATKLLLHKLLLISCFYLSCYWLRCFHRPPLKTLYLLLCFKKAEIFHKTKSYFADLQLAGPEVVRNFDSVDKYFEVVGT